MDDLVKIIAEKENFDCYDSEINSGSKKGDNYMGNISSISIKGKNKEGEEKMLDVIAKAAMTNEKVRTIMKIPVIFQNEIAMYTKIFRVFGEFQKEKNIKNPFRSFAECIYASMDAPNEVIVLENLRKKGFQLWDRLLPMNADHVGLVLKEYGRFHAVSFALRDQKPEIFHDLSKELKNFFQYKFDQSTSNNYYKGMADVFKDQEDIYGVLKDLIESRKDFMPETFIEDQYTVFLHGDCWCNNMMFKYQNNSLKPEEIRFLDFQLSRLGNPVLDLSYFLYSSTSKEILDDFDFYIELYHESFRNHQKALGGDPEFYPKEKLEEHLKKFSKFGLRICLTVLRVVLTEEDYVDLDKAAEEGKNVIETFKQAKGAFSEEYQKRIKFVVKHMLEKKFL